jgi:polar amino acid transport system permease protein
VSEVGQPAGARPEAGSAPAVVAEDIRAVPVRHWGRLVGAAVVLLLAAWLVQALVSSHAIKFDLVRRYQFQQQILIGLRNTITLSILAQAMGVALGVLFAVMRLARNPVLGAVSAFYIWFFRGTPVLVQLIFWFNVSLVFRNLTVALPFTHLTLFTEPMNQFMTPFMAALLGLGLNEGAYMAEIVRAGILSVDEGQNEAAHALGMTRMQTMRRIVLPQAMRVIIPPTGNETISMLKTTSLVSVIATQELLYSAQLIYSVNYRQIPLLIVASLWYLLVTSVLSVGQYYVERRFGRGTSREQPPTPWQRLRTNLRYIRPPANA